MEQQIRAILSGLPGVKVKPEGALWCISVGSLSGARENGESLARDLRKQYEYIRDRERAADNVHFAAPQPVEIPAFLQEAPDEMDAIKAELAALKAERDEVPEGLKEFVREGEPHGEAQTRLWKLYTELTGKMMLKLATSEETRTHTRLHGALYWVSRGAVDVI